MQKADQYRLRAAECLALAFRMPSAEEKNQLRHMANVWEDLAASVEASDVAAVRRQVGQPSTTNAERIRGWSDRSNPLRCKHR